MKAIGFANKFYTLWNITEDVRDLGNGHKYIVTHFCYIKNISQSRETAEEKYPGVTVDESLRGKTVSFNTHKDTWDNVDTFRFGKYAYMKIADNTDTGYIEWYWDNISDPAHKEYVAKVLTDRGYEVRKDGFSEWVVSPEVLENERRAKAEADALIERLKDSNSIEVTIKCNPDEDGYYRDGNVLYKFDSVIENYYRGFYYYLPAINGKAKRVKNKTIVITNFTYKMDNDTLTVYIRNWKIKK